MPVSGPGDDTTWTATDPKAITAALRALRERYRVTTSRPASVHRAWLDTADWRLYRSGQALSVTDAGLHLTGPGDTPPLVCPDRPDVVGWPRLLGDLPDDLADRLGPVVDIRALLPVVDVVGPVLTGALIDDEGKTVVRLEVDRPARATRAEGLPGYAGSDVTVGTLPARLRLVPVRGYGSDAVRAARDVRAAGLTRDERGAYQRALAAAGLAPDAVRRPAMVGDDPAGLAVARVLLDFLDDMDATLDGTIADVDAEFLHDFRVAVRRSRSAVKLLGDVLPPRAVGWAGPELKWLGDLTTPMRDLDVHLLGLPDAAARLHGGRPEDLDPLAAYLERVRVGERRTLVRGLRSARCTRFRQRWRTELTKAATAVVDVEAEPTAAEFGLRRVVRAYRRVVRPGSQITPASPAEALHDLRKRGKELRYLLEIFSPLLEGDDARRLVRELKGLQDVLGTFQDSEVQRLAVVSMAEAMLAADAAPAATLLAMGEIAAHLHDDQVKSRDEFARRFERFAAAPAGALAP